MKQIVPESQSQASSSPGPTRRLDYPAGRSGDSGLCGATRRCRSVRTAAARRASPRSSRPGALRAARSRWSSSAGPRRSRGRRQRTGHIGDRETGRTRFHGEPERAASPDPAARPAPGAPRRSRPHHGSPAAHGGKGRVDLQRPPGHGVDHPAPAQASVQRDAQRHDPQLGSAAVIPALVPIHGDQHDPVGLLVGGDRERAGAAAAVALWR